MIRRLLVASFLSLSAGAATVDVVLNTPTGALHGTLLTPDAGNEPVPVALIIAGSGPTDRDGNSTLLPGANDSLLMLAEALERNGVASVRYDKRGVGESRDAAPSESELRFDTYVDDAVAWLAQLRAGGRFSSVHVVGHSEGSLIAILAAQRAGVARVVSIAGAGYPAGDVILRQLEGKVSPELLSAARNIVTELKAGRTVANPPAALNALFRPSIQPYLISWFRYDPAAEIARLEVPVLIAQGTTDIQMSPDDAARLAGGARNGTLLVIEGMNHVMKDVPQDPAMQERSYSDPSFPLDPTLASAAGTFINARPKRRAARHE